MLRIDGRDLAPAVLLAVTTKDDYRSVTNIVSSVIEPHAPESRLGRALDKGALALILGLMLPSGVVAEPQVLADWELDSITAAGVLVEVGSVAAALGDSGISRTDGRTFVFGGEHLELGVGITVGEALACCGEDADVVVGSTVLGEGDIVHDVTHSVRRDGPVLARGVSVGLVVAISYGRHFAVRDQQVAVLEELRAALAAFRIDLPDAKSAAALVSDRWSDIMGIQ